MVAAVTSSCASAVVKIIAALAGVVDPNSAPHSYMEACYVARTPMTSTRIMATAHNEFLKAQFASLPPLPAIEKLSESVWRILGGNPGKV